MGHFAFLDPDLDPLTWLNPDPIRIRIRNTGWKRSYLSPLLPNPSRLQSEGPPEELYSDPTFGRVMRCNAGRRLVKTYRVEGNIVHMRLYERLKVDSNENRGGSERRHLLSFSLGLWRSRVIFSLKVLIPCKNSLFPFPLVTAKLTGDVLSFFDHFTPSIRFAYSVCEHSQSQWYWRNHS